MAASDAQERGKPEMLFRNLWQRSTPKGFGANEIVLGEWVEEAGGRMSQTGAEATLTNRERCSCAIIQANE